MASGSKARVQVVGVRELEARLGKMRTVDLPKEVRLANKDGALIVAKAAVPKAPVQSGRLARSIGTRSTTKYGAVKAGGSATVPYAAPIHWGWPAHNIDPQPFLYDAADERADEVQKAYEKRLDEMCEDVSARGPDLT